MKLTVTFDFDEILGVIPGQPNKPEQIIMLLGDIAKFLQHWRAVFAQAGDTENLLYVEFLSVLLSRVAEQHIMQHLPQHLPAFQRGKKSSFLASKAEEN